MGVVLARCWGTRASVSDRDRGRVRPIGGGFADRASVHTASAAYLAGGRQQEGRMAGIAVITEACIDVKDRACVEVCPVQCIYEYDPQTSRLFSEEEPGSRVTENTHAADPDAIGVFGDSILYVNLDECTSCTACYQPDVCPVGAIYRDEELPDGGPKAIYNAKDPNKGHDHTYFLQLSQEVFAD